MRPLSLPTLAALILMGGSLHLMAFPQQLNGTETSLRKSGQSQVSFLRFIKLFDAALYLEPGYTVDEYPGDFGYALSIKYQRDFKKEHLMESAEVILNDLHAPETLESIREEIEKINSFYADVSKGDVYTLLYEPGRGTTLLYNGMELVTIPGNKFAGIYFSIWLGGHPKSAPLKEDLLNS